MPELSPLIDRSARDRGMPAHVTLLYPFLPINAIDSAVERTIAATMAGLPAFDVTFARLGRFPGVIYLAPDPPDPLIALTTAVAVRWPEHPPYAGAYETTVPHLTVAYGDSVPGAIARLTPVRVRADETWLMARALGRWSCIGRYALGLSEGSGPARAAGAAEEAQGG